MSMALRVLDTKTHFTPQQNTYWSNALLNSVIPMWRFADKDMIKACCVVARATTLTWLFPISCTVVVIIIILLIDIWMLLHIQKIYKINFASDLYLNFRKTLISPFVWSILSTWHFSTVLSTNRTSCCTAIQWNHIVFLPYAVSQSLLYDFDLKFCGSKYVCYLSPYRLRRWIFQLGYLYPGFGSFVSQLSSDVGFLLQLVSCCSS